MEQKDLTESVKYLLTKYPLLRNDDALLIYFVIINSYVEKVDIPPQMFSDLCFSDVMMNWSSWGLPSVELVIKTKKRLQHKYPELRAAEEKKNKGGN